MVDLNSHFLIARLVPSILGMIPLTERPQTALYMIVDARLSHYGKKTSTSWGRGTHHHLLFRAPHGVHGAINTFHFEEPEKWLDPKDKGFPWDRFENLSNHDSCWASSVDGKLSEAYFKMASSIMEEVKLTQNSHKIAPCDMHQLNLIDRMSRVTVKLERVHDPKYGSDRYKVSEATDVKSLDGL